MKTIENFFPIVLIIAVLLSSLDLSANTQITVIKPRPQLETNPPKKKYRKCAVWRPDRFFKKGQLDAVFGLGLIPTFQVDRAKVKMLPLSLGFEYRFSEKFSLGVVASHSVSESKPRVIQDGTEASWENSFYHFALRPAVHIDRVEDWDFYGGFSIGMNKSIIDGRSDNTEIDLLEIESHLGIERKRTSAAYSGFAGARYVLSPKWTVGGEIGFGISIVTVGVNYLLN